MPKSSATASLATAVPSGMSQPAPGVVRLARRIVALAAAGRWPTGRHLPEVELVAALDVSRTPIRAALRLLEQEGVLEAQPNRGFFLLRDGASLATFDLEQVPTAVEALYARILGDRIAGALPRAIAPSHLMSFYESGRAIVGQVLARLSDDGLVTRTGRTWTFVDTLSDAGSVRASYEFRLAVEPAALRATGFRFERDALGRLRDRHRALVTRLTKGSEDLPATRLRASIVGLDADFHEGLADLSGNPFAAAAIKQQVGLRRLLEFGIQEKPRRVTTWCHEHLAVLDALLAGKCDVAADELSAHLRCALDRYEALH